MNLNRIGPSQLLVLSFLGLIIIGALLLSTPWAVQSGQGNFMTALFTSTSAVCVTGLVVVDTATHWSPFGHLVIITLIQIGGLGVMSFATFFAFLFGWKIHLRQRLIMQQAINQSSLGGVVRIFRYLLITSFAVEAIGALILALRWTPLLGFKQALWFGIFHSISAFNNAGFDLFGNFQSLTAFATDFTVGMTISMLLIFGGLGFMVMHELLHYYKDRTLSLHARVVVITTAALLGAGTLIILGTEYNHALKDLPWVGKILASFFQIASSRTAGFTFINLNSFFLSSHFLIIILMFIGGSPGSTGGGIKTSTFALMWIAIISRIRGKRDNEIFGRRIPTSDMFLALTIVLLYGFAVIAITFLFTLSHQKDFLPVIFEVVSALGTNGLSLGLTPHHTSLEQFLLVVTMFLGRVGPLTLGFALAYKRKQPLLRYPEGKIMVG